MMLSLILLGLLSSLALGPTSFRIIHQLLTDQKYPRAEISGYLLADLIYIILSLGLMHSPLLQNSTLKVALTLLSSGTLLIFSLHLLWGQKKPAPEVSAQSGFWRVFFLTLGNFHLPLLYAGLFAGLLQGSSLHIVLGAGLYMLSFAGGFLLLLSVLKSFQGALQKILRRIEVVVSFGFIFFSLYLSWGIL